MNRLRNAAVRLIWNVPWLLLGVGIWYLVRRYELFDFPPTYLIVGLSVGLIVVGSMLDRK